MSTLDLDPLLVEVNRLKLLLNDPQPEDEGWFETFGASMEVISVAWNTSKLKRAMESLSKLPRPSLEKVRLQFAASVRIGAQLDAEDKERDILINIIANSIAADSSGESRSAKQELAMQLLPHAVRMIEAALAEHPINVRWDEYVKAKPEERAAFMLPES
jgi:hypothetical protein